MRRNTQIFNSQTGRLLSHITADKKKTALAASLIALMLFMWIRVFLGKGPESAKAGNNQVIAADNKENTTALKKVSYIELPVASSRNDIISRDFFDSQNWENFIDKDNNNLSRVNEVNNTAENAVEKAILNTAGKIKLEAIWIGSNSQAYINNKLLMVSDKLLVSDGGKTYEFEVISINNDDVVIRCEGVQVILELPDVTKEGKLN